LTPVPSTVLPALLAAALGGGNDVVAGCQDLEHLVGELVEVGVGGVNHHVGGGVYLFELPLHLQTEGTVETGDLAGVLAHLGRVDVHGADQVQILPLVDQSCRGTTDGTEPVLNHSCIVTHCCCLLLL